MEPEKISEGRVVAFIDIGTNSVRLLLVRINPNGSYQPLTKQKETVRLGDKEFIDRILQPKAMERATFVCLQGRRDYSCGNLCNTGRKQ
jgi:exopolyphosphatase/guanosine-5'-triphosphate,3'-diphosphate pyrophosphatase